MNSISRRTAFLDEIGIGPVWLRRHAGGEPLESAPALAVVAEAAAEPVNAVAEVELPAAPALVAIEPMPAAAAMQPLPSRAEIIDPIISAWSDEPGPSVVR